MHILYGGIYAPYAPVWVTRVLWPHIDILMLLLAAELRSTAGLFIRLSVSLWNNLADPAFDGVGLAGFRAMLSMGLVLLCWGLRS